MLKKGGRNKLKNINSYNTGKGYISILSKKFDVTGNLDISDSIETSTININNRAIINNLEANYGNIGDSYNYSYINKIISYSNTFITLGTSQNSSNSIQTSTNGSNWSNISTGGFSPIITYENNRIRTSTESKAILINNDSSIVVAYGLTNEALMSNDFSSTIQYSSSFREWNRHTGNNTLNTFILDNINDALYTNGKYMLLTSIAESPVLVSKTMGEFNIGANRNDIAYSNFHNNKLTSSLSAAYGFHKDSSRTYIVGTANSVYTANGNSPVFFSENGKDFYMPYLNSGTSTIQSNMPPTFYDITRDTSNDILFMVGPGISNNDTSLSTFMYSLNKGVNWSDGGLEGVISARSVSWGYDSIKNNHTVLVSCEALASSNTIITYTYTNSGNFNPYVGNTITSNTVTMLRSINNGSNWTNINEGIFTQGIVNSISYNNINFRWYAGGNNNSNFIVAESSNNGSNWAPIYTGNISSIKINSILGGNFYTTPDCVYILGSGENTLYGIYKDTTWKPFSIANTFDTAAHGISYNNNMTVAVGEGKVSGSILYSDNLNTMKNTVTGEFSIAGYGVTYGNNMWVAVGKSLTTSNILYSKNGSNWSNATFGAFDIQGQAVAYKDTPQDNMWVAVGKGIITSNILYSTDGSNWLNAKTPTFSNIGYGVTWNGTTNFIAVGDSGTLTSSNGSNWYPVVSGDFKSQSTITGTGTITVLESVGKSVVSNGAGVLIAVGSTSNTNRIYNWSNVSNLGTSDGFTSLISEDGLSLTETHIGTASIYNPLTSTFIVGGLTNDTSSSIVNGNNIWNKSQYNSFDGKYNLQFINSSNRTIVANEIITNKLNSIDIIEGGIITATNRFIGDGSKLTGVNTGSSYVYKVSQNNVKHRSPVYEFTDCFIPNNSTIYSIYKVLVGTQPTSGSGSYHIAEILLKGTDTLSLTYINHIKSGTDFNTDVVNTLGDNATTVPTKGIFFKQTSNKYVLYYSTINNYDYINGMFASIQQQV